jgi:hypothetical protein
MASKIQIVNYALRLLGVARLTALDDDVEGARVADDVYDICRDDVLSDHNWNFATKRDTLAALEDAPEFGFDVQYQLPNDCLRVVQMEDLDSVYKVEGKYLLTNESAANIIYIAQITDTTYYSPKFVSCLAARLAAEMAFPLTSSKSKEQLMWELYEAKITEARWVDGVEGSADQLETEDWIEAR